MTNSQVLELSIPVIATVFTYIVSQDGLDQRGLAWVNALFAFAFVVAAGIATAFVGGSLTHDLAADVGIIMTATAGLQALPHLQPLFDKIQTNWLRIGGGPTPPIPPVIPVPVSIQPVESNGAPSNTLP